MGKIFLSYRRNDTAYITGRLFDRLAAHFGADQVFRDIDTIPAGADFVEHIEQAVASSCDAFVAVIGADWLTAGHDGRRRIDDRNDFVRLEIAAALERDVLVVPVLVENARMPAETDLPAPLTKLARRNAIELSDTR